MPAGVSKSLTSSDAGLLVSFELPRLPSPPQSPDRFELADWHGTSFIPSPRPRSHQHVHHYRPLGLVDLESIKIRVQQHKQDGIPFLLNANRPDPVSRLGHIHQTAPFDLQLPCSPFNFFERVVANLPRR